jgi:hypothetical protein
MPLPSRCTCSAPANHLVALWPRNARYGGNSRVFQMQTMLVMLAAAR